MALGDDLGHIHPGHFGRGPGKIIFTAHSVIKTAPRREPMMMKAFPDVFAPVVWIDEKKHISDSFADDTRYMMPKLRIPDVEKDTAQALIAGSARLQRLWTIDVGHHLQVPHWRMKLTNHLINVIDQHRLNVSLAQLTHILEALPEPERWCLIHGDATLANLVYDNQIRHQWLWLDPLQRDYIPGDPHVDLGKMFQSCLGYERALLNLPLNPDRGLAERLARGHKLVERYGWRWCFIHCVRLLPYQDKRMRDIFEGVLNQWEELTRS